MRSKGTGGGNAYGKKRLNILQDRGFGEACTRVLRFSDVYTSLRYGF